MRSENHESWNKWKTNVGKKPAGDEVMEYDVFQLNVFH